MVMANLNLLKKGITSGLILIIYTESAPWEAEDWSE